MLTLLIFTSIHAKGLNVYNGNQLAMLNSNVEIIDIVAVYSDDKQTSNIEELWDDVSLLRDQIDLVKQLL